MTTRTTITTRRFSFPQLVYSHGWAWLAPFAWDDASRTLARPLTLGNRRHVRVVIGVRNAGARSQVTATVGGKLDPQERQTLRAAVRRMLRLEEDFAEFHAVCAVEPRLKSVARSRSGGMLRAPTAFEDLIKTVCCTNCAWGNTQRMCEALCQLEEGAFPRAATLLRFNERQLAARVPLGYRAKTVLLLARLHEEGRLPLDQWAAEGDFDQIRQALTPVWGIGPYALNHILVLLGCYDEIPVDSLAIRFLRDTHFGGKAVSPQEAVRPYERYGKYRFLAYQFSRR